MIVLSRDERDWYSRANEQDRTGWNRKINAVSRIIFFLKISLKHHLKMAKGNCLYFSHFSPQPFLNGVSMRFSKKYYPANRVYLPVPSCHILFICSRIAISLKPGQDNHGLKKCLPYRWLDVFIFKLFSSPLMLQQNKLACLCFQF